VVNTLRRLSSFESCLWLRVLRLVRNSLSLMSGLSQTVLLYVTLQDVPLRM